MNLSGIKDFAKSYTSLLVPVVISLVAILLLVPGRLMSKRLRTRIEAESLRKGRTIQSMKGDVVSGEQWKQEQQYQQLHEADANRIALLARQTTQRQLLTYEMFPEPNTPSLFIYDDFAQRFKQALGSLVEQLNAGDCPTKAQLDEAKGGARGRAYYRPGLSGIGETIEEELCRRKAQSISVYVNPDDLGPYGRWAEFKYSGEQSKEEILKDCWYSQLSFWIFEDIFAAVDTMNAGSDSVFTSPVKRLLNVEFPGGKRKRSTTRVVGAGRKRRQSTMPSYVLATEGAAVNSLTQRASDDSIDVVHFKCAVILAADKVLRFMQELCTAKEHVFTGWDNTQPPQVFKHNQITILDSEIVPVDTETASSPHKLYRYGDDPIVQLNLTCEYLFDKKAYDEVKPQVVKDEIAGKGEEKDQNRTGRRPTRGR